MPKKIINAAEIRKAFAMVMKRDLNSKLYNELSLSNSAQAIQGSCSATTPPGYRLIRVDDRRESKIKTFEIALLCDITKQVAYYNYVSVTSISDLNAKPASQCLVWKSPDILHKAATRDLPSAVFFDYILPKYDVIMSDGNQTSGGQFFWETQITTALQNGNQVYFYKMMSAELEPIKDRDDFDLLKDMIWGETEDHQHHLVLISTEKLPLGRKYEMPIELIEELDKEDVSNPSNKIWNDPDLT